MTAWHWGASLVTQAYDLLHAYGSLGCYAMVIAAVRLAAWGVRLTDDRRPSGVVESHETHRPLRPRKPMGRRCERAAGYALQLSGAALVALAAVALARVLTES